MSSKLIHQRSVYSRGLNMQGQLGLNNYKKSVVEFTKVPELDSTDISKLVTSDQSNIALVNQGFQAVYWGWPLCTRTQYRFLETYERVPRIVTFLSKYTFLFSSGIDKPTLETTFTNPIVDLQMGCGYIAALDSHNNVLAWGDNYAGQLG